MRIYLVPRRAAPQPFWCKLENGVPVAAEPGAAGAGLCRRSVIRPPTWRPYVFLGRLGEERRGSAALRFRVPRVCPGRYRFVIYCARCYPGRGGSLVTSGPVFHVRG